MDSTGVGANIARARKLRGYTQERLAGEITYSVSMVRKVERGLEPVSPAFLSATARALRVDVNDLTGAPYRETIELDGGLDGLSDLRAILAGGSTCERPNHSHSTN